MEAPLEILNVVLMPVVLVIVGNIILRVLLRLATFSRSDGVFVLSRSWFWAGIRCAILYTVLRLDLVMEAFRWWQEDLWSTIYQLPVEIRLIAMMGVMLFPLVLLGFGFFLLPGRSWLFGLLSSHPLIVWKTRRKVVIGTFFAFVLSLVLWALSVKGPVLFFFLATALSLELINPTLIREGTHKYFRRWMLPAVWLFYWGVACIGWQYKWLGLFFVTLPTLLIVGGWLFLAAGAILPFPDVALYLGEKQSDQGSRKNMGLFDSLRYPTRRERGSLPSLNRDVIYLIAVLRQEVLYWWTLFKKCPSALFYYWFALLIFPADHSTVKRAKDSLEQCVVRCQVSEQYVKQHRVLMEYVDRRRKTLRCLLTYALGTNYSYHVVVDEKIRYRTEEERTWLTGEERLVKRVEGDAYGGFLAGPGVVVSGCDHAVVVSAGTTFKGAKGPGVVFTGYADAPTQAIDLKVHLRAFSVRAWTKDGIAVKLLMFVPFQVDTGREKPSLGRGFPYRPSAVFKAVQAQPMVHEGPSQIPEHINRLSWYDMPQLIGERVIRDIISCYEFDDLYAPFKLYGDLNQHPRVQIAWALRENLDAELPRLGIKRIGGGIGNIEPVDESVLKQRVEFWKAGWMREVMRRQARGQSVRLRLVEHARAQAQADIIKDVGNRIRQLRDVEEPARLDVLLRYFIEVLEQLAHRWELREILPGDMGTIMQALHAAADSEVSVTRGEQKED